MSELSALTTLSSLSSPPDTTFYTAKSTPSGTPATTRTSNPDGEEETPLYLEARLPPHELKEHCRIQLEEQLYQSALHLIESLLTIGQAHKPRSGAKPRPAVVPPPAQIALLSTLTIHPLYTTRPVKRGHLHVGTESRRFLQNLLAVAGPLNANFGAAFAFRKSYGRRDRSGRAGDWSNGNSDNDSDEDGLHGNKLGRESSVWRRVPDFWAVLGWAFNCSALHPHRWRYWKLWLEFMLDVLVADWRERDRIDTETLERLEQTGDIKHAGFNWQMLRESMLMKYVESLQAERKNPLREIMRALSAAGRPTDTALFKEVFEKETVTERQNKRKREAALVKSKVDLENQEWGDYFNDEVDLESSDESDSAAQGGPKARGRGRGRPPKVEVNNSSPPVTTGMIESAQMRLRIFALLSAACDRLPDAFASVADLYDEFAEVVRGSPLGMYKQYVAFQPGLLLDQVYVTLMRQVLENMLPASAPKPQKVDRVVDDSNGISQKLLERCFLPFAANTVTAENNAKLSLVLEHLLRFIWTEREIEYSEVLGNSIITGITARNEKIKKRNTNRGKFDANEQAALETLEESGKALELLSVILSSAAYQDEDSEMGNA